MSTHFPFGSNESPNLQFALDFSKRLPVSAQIGMAQCDANADENWKREVDAAIRQVALSYQFFTADEVVQELVRNQFHFTTHNASALGPRLKEVSESLCYMEATNGFKRSERKKAHGNLLRVWRSRIFRDQLGTGHEGTGSLQSSLLSGKKKGRCTTNEK